MVHEWLQIRARDQDSKWLTALALLDDDTFLAADNSHNLVSLSIGVALFRLSSISCQG
jgi:hypothetical protein